METRIRLAHFAAVAALAALISGCGVGGSGGITPDQGAAARPQSLQQSSLQATSQSPQVTHYRLIVMGTLGGPNASGISDNQQGWVSGFSLLSNNATVHAALWYPLAASALDLGTLGGVNSAVEWPNHATGEVVGISQTAQVDPLNEQWSCSYPAGGGFLPYTGNECRGFVWRSGHMIPLGTLGGNNSFAAGSNDVGDVAGWAETATHDPTCTTPQVLQFEGVVWNQAGIPSVMPPLPGDSDSAATSVNDSGNAVGISGICQNAVGALSAKHMVIWRSGVANKIPGLGGAAWNTPEWINNLDEVVGFSDLPGDDNGSNFNAHAFLWTPTTSTIDLGTFSTDVISYAYSVNDRGVIVGQSCSAGCATSRAIVYRGGKMYDLNTLVEPANSAYYLLFANDVNDAGQITGGALDTTTNSLVAFRLIPVSQESSIATRTQTHPVLVPKALGLHMGPFGRMILNPPESI
jgi:probable HAF family extracellular repeat protein